MPMNLIPYLERSYFTLVCTSAFIDMFCILRFLQIGGGIKLLFQFYSYDDNPASSKRN